MPIESENDPEELGHNPFHNNALPYKIASKELSPAQGFLDLGIERQAEVDGIGMGVLKDGTAFLTGRGLARLVGIENLHIRTIGSEWNEAIPKPRIREIKALLANGFNGSSLF